MANQSLKVYQAINAVQRALASSGISKDRQATGFGSGYAFRGIDDVYNAIAPLLAEHKLVIIPRCVERTETQRPSGNKTLYFVLVKMEFDFISSEDGSKHVACVFGEAMDAGDKATNKAMSIAYKYACFQTFAIPTEGDNDPDATVHAPGNAQAKTKQAAGQQQQPQPNQPAGEQAKSLATILDDINKARNVDTLAMIRDYVAAREYSESDIGEVKQALKSRHDQLMQKRPAQANQQHGQSQGFKPLQSVLKDILATKTVHDLTDIKNYVFNVGHGEEGYTEHDFRIIKNQLAAQHDKLVKYPTKSPAPAVRPNLDDPIPF